MMNETQITTNQLSKSYMLSQSNRELPDLQVAKDSFVSLQFL